VAYIRIVRGLLLFALFSVLNVPVFTQNMFRKINDFDGDGKADFAVTRNDGGNKIWYVWRTAGGFTAFQWGFATDEIAAGDYDGDGKTDPGIFRKEVLSPSTMRYSFWVNRSQQGVMSLIIGPTNNYPESVAYQQDFNGNGKTDVAFTIDNHARYWVWWDGGGSIAYNNPGGTFIKLGDMIGDGRADAAGYDPTSNLVSIREPGFGPIQTVAFGTTGDEYVAADFDGDGKGDLTVFRQSNGQWWWMRSSDNVVNAATFGSSGDVPVPADYDGDGETDLAVWRAGSQSHYWVSGSQIGVFLVPWGISGDTVVRY
jgi:hypothetical protein